MSTTVKIAKAGLNRFFDEGYVRWPEEKLRAAFGNRSLSDPEITDALKRWKDAGWIDLPMRRDEYLTMMARISD